MQSHLKAKMDRIEQEKAAQAEYRRFIQIRNIWFKVMIGLSVLPILATLVEARGNHPLVKVGAISLVAAVIVGVVGVVAFFIYISKPSEARQVRERLAGSTVDVLTEDQEGDGVPIGKARMPARAEPLHILIEGATGTGKTQLLKQVTAYLRQRGDTVVVVDTNFDLFNTFGKPGDILLSPFDPRSPGWSPANEIEAPTDWNALAETLIAPGEGDAKEWNAMARAFFAAVARGYHQAVQEAGEPFDFKELVHLLTAAPPEQVEPFLVGSAAASLAQNEKGMGNIRMSFYDSLSFVQDLKDGYFSARRWVRSGANGQPRPCIFMPHTKKTIAASRTLIATWLDQIISEACDQGENSNNRVWIIIDELSSLGRIPALETAVTELRKTGFRVAVGIQNYEQIEQRYSKTGAATIGNNLSSRIIFRANGPDAAERASKLIGDARHRVTSISTSSSNSSGDRSGSSSSGSSIAVTEQVERVVLPSEILALPDLTAFVKFAGSDTALLTEIQIYKGPKTGGWQLETEKGTGMKTDMTNRRIESARDLEKLAGAVARLGVGTHRQANINMAIGPEAAEAVGRNWTALRPILHQQGLEIGFTPGEGGIYDLEITELRTA
jgi:type IV secretory pathway TraG/TraD family ATPase VirD4